MKIHWESLIFRLGSNTPIVQRNQTKQESWYKYQSRSIWHILSKYHLWMKNHGPSLWQKRTFDSKVFPLGYLTSPKELSSASLSTFFTKRSSSYGFPGTESWLLNLRMTLASTLISIRFWSSTYLIGFTMWKTETIKLRPNFWGKCKERLWGHEYPQTREKTYMHFKKLVFMLRNHMNICGNNWVFSAW